MLDILGTIGFDWRVALANLVSFLTIFFLLKKYVFGNVSKIIEERKKEISDGLYKAQQSESELILVKQKVEKELLEAKKKANDIIAEAKERGDKLILKAKEDAITKANDILDKANRDIEEKRSQIEDELLKKTAGLVTLGIEKILEEQVNESKNKEINQRALEILRKI